MVNNVDAFTLIAALIAENEALASSVSKAFDSLSIDYMFTNTYFFVKRLEGGGYRTASIEEVVDTLAAVSKIDGDSMGSLVALLGASPSRLATFSTLLSIVFNAKPNLMLLSASARVYEECGGDPHCYEARQPKVAIIYAGGDDVTLFGEWREVTRFLSTLRKELASGLYPVTFSAGVGLERVRHPLSEGYRLALELLEEAKEAGGDAVALPLPGGPTPGRHSILEAESLERITSLIEAKDRLLEYKSLVYRLLRLALAARDEKTAPTVYVNYVYMWPRRRRQLEELIDLLGKTGIELPRVDLEENRVPPIRETREKLLEAAPYLALAYLTLRT